MHEQIRQIAEEVSALADPMKALEELIAQHTIQLEQLLSPTPEPPTPEPPTPTPPGERTGIVWNACSNLGNCGGDLPRGMYWNQYSPTVVPSGEYGVTAREGSHMLDCYLNRETSKPSYAHRTMAILNPDDNAEPDAKPSWLLPLRQDWWIGFSMHLQPDWIYDPLSTILFQAQAWPDKGETYRQPIFHIAAKGDDWQVKLRWDERELSPASEGTTSFPGSKELYRQPLAPDLGKWTDWVIHARWDWSQGGIIQVWKNGEMIADYIGPCCSNDAQGPQLAFGVYEWSWREQYWKKFNYRAVWRRVLYDSLRVGDHTASYQDVAP